MVVAEPPAPGRVERGHLLADARPHLELDRVALAVGKADGLDAREALERPGEAYGRILAAGEQHQRGVAAQSHFGAPDHVTTRPPRCARLRISSISAAFSTKLKMSMFSDSRSTREVRGMAIAPSWTRKRSDTC